MHEYVNIIFLSNDWDEYHRKAFTEKLVKQLGLWSRIVLVQLPVSLSVHLFTNFRKKIVGLIGGKYKTREIESSTYLFTPVIIFHYLLWGKSKIFFKIDFWLMNLQLKKFIGKKINQAEKIIWYYFPYFNYFALKYDAKLKIYDQYDIYHMDIKGNIDKKIKNMNEELILNSDIVFCTTKYLYNMSVKENGNSFYITNGNNYEFLSAPRNEKAVINLPIGNGKIIGYLGGIRDWIDFDLLEYIIKELSQVNFLFIGSIYNNAINEMKKLTKNKNVIWLNYVQPELLPLYLSNFDAGIIPFKNSEFFKSVFPNKFFEYLASGLPVVTTSLSELKKYENLIGFSHGKSEFLENCRKALNGHFDKYKEEYSRISRENSWSEKAQEVSNIVKNGIIKKEQNI